MTQDILIQAPPAVARGSIIMPGESIPSLSPETLVKLQAARIAELEQQYQQQGVALQTIANVAISLVKLLAPNLGEIVVPRELSDSVLGARLDIAETPDGDVGVTITEPEA